MAVEPLSVKSVRLMVEKAEQMGLGDQVPERLREIVMGDVPSNGGAIGWWRLNHEMPEADWPVGCCMGNDIKDPGYCTCWVPVYDLEQEPPKIVASWLDCPTQPTMCGDCAYRPGSPERTEDGGFMEEALFSLARTGKDVFFCHEDNRRPVRWEHPDGRTVPGDPADYQPPFIAGVPYRSSGDPSLVCAGWSAHREAARRAAAEPAPDWLLALTGMQAAGEIGPGGMMWIDGDPPPVPNRGGGYILGQVPRKDKGRKELRERDRYRHLPKETPVTPIEVRREIIKALMSRPTRWARVFDGGMNSAGSMSAWYRHHTPPWLPIEAASRRDGLTIAVYARHMPRGVI